MADKIKRLGVGIKLDTASIKSELNNLKALFNETLKSTGFTGSGADLTRQVKAAADQMKQIKRDLAAYEKAQAREVAREEVAMARQANREIQALQKARIQQAAAVNKSLTASGGFNWMTGGMDATTRAQTVAHYKTLGQEARHAEGKVFSLNSTLLAASVVAGTVASSFYTMKGAIDAALRMERITLSMAAVTDNAVLAARDVQFLREESERLGLVFADSTQEFIKFAAAAKNTSLEGETSRKVFSGISEAIVALKLTSQDANLIYMAMTQMVSKGVISMEELRRQMGERLPGAIRLAAEGMGMSTAELIKHIEKGEVLASDLLPKLAAKLHEVYGKAATEAAKQGQAEINRLNNAVFEMKATLGEELMPTLTSVLKELREWTPAVNLTIRAVKQLREELTSLPTSRRLLDLVPGLGQSDLADTIKMREQIQHMRDLINLAKPGSMPDVASSTKSMLELSEEQKRTAAAKAREEADAKNAKNKKGTGSGLSAEKMAIGAIKEYTEALIAAKKAESELQFHLLGNQRKLGYLGTDEYFNAAVANAEKSLDYQLETLQNKLKALKENYDLSMGKEGLGGDQQDALTKKYLADVQAVDRDVEVAKAEHYKKLGDLGLAYHQERAKLILDEAQHAVNMQKLAAQELVANNQWSVDERKRQVEWLYQNDMMNAVQYYSENGRLIEQNKQVALQAIQVEYDAWQKMWNDKVSIAQGKQEQLDALNREKAQKDRELENVIAEVNRRSTSEMADNYRELSGTFNSIFVQPMKTGLKDFLDYSSEGFMNFRDLALNVLHDIYMEMVQKFLVNSLFNAFSGGTGSIMSTGIGLLGSLLGGGSGGMSNSGAYAAFGSGFSFLGSARGNVFSTAGLKPYLNTVVDRPTLFAFAKGAGVFGEDGAEAIMPLRRTRSGNLGVETTGSGGPATVKVSLVVNNNTGQQFATRQETSRGVNPQELIVTLWLDALERNSYGLRSAIGR